MKMIIVAFVAICAAAVVASCADLTAPTGKTEQYQCQLDPETGQCKTNYDPIDPYDQSYYQAELPSGSVNIDSIRCGQMSETGGSVMCEGTWAIPYGAWLRVTCAFRTVWDPEAEVIVVTEVLWCTTCYPCR